ncbi:Uncharacterised protein [Vibrio cholerae]|nr:Uncharacterised protein [Vibrio cholerae]
MSVGWGGELIGKYFVANGPKAARFSRNHKQGWTKTVLMIHDFGGRCCLKRPMFVSQMWTYKLVVKLLLLARRIQWPKLVYLHRILPVVSHLKLAFPFGVFMNF